MNETPFYLTKSRRQFYEVTMPELVRELHRLNELRERLAEPIRPCSETCSRDQADDQAD